MRREDNSEHNAEVEIHDSDLERIETHGADVLVVLRAYVHRSAGRPGIDAGTGWVQPVHLHFSTATTSGNMAALPLDLLDGRLILSGETFDNCIPMPLTHVGPSRIELESWNDVKVVIEGAGLSAVFAGPPEYIEDFQP
jgi:hypothetical protein